jgi:hypothetical protein
MMNFIGTTEGQFINLAACVVIEDVSDETGPTIARITTTAGVDLEITGDDAEALLNRTALIAALTDNAQQIMIQQTEAAAQAANQGATK